MLTHYWAKIPGWFQYQPAYDKLLALAPDTPSTIVEIGAFQGRSTSYLGVEIVNSGKPISLVVIDTFLGEGVPEGEMKKVPPPQLRQVFHNNTKPVADALGERFSVMEMPSQDAHTHFKDESLFAVWIDGNHAEEPVREDIKGFYPKVAPGGWIGGDDLNWPGVNAAVYDIFAGMKIETARNKTWFLLQKPEKTDG